MFAITLMLTSVVGQMDWVPTGKFAHLDAEWDTYIEEIQPDYDEKETVPPSTEDVESTTETSKVYDWDLMGPGETPFVAILYQPSKSSPVVMEVTPKRACGGILVSANTVVTPCGCIMSFMEHIAQKKFVRKTKPIGEFSYDMDADDNPKDEGKLNRIYVVFSQAEFDGSSRDYYLDDNIQQFQASECYHRTDKYWVKQGQPKSLDSRKIDAILTAWRLKPAIGFPVPGQFMPWPPKTSTTPDEKVVISGFGFNAKENSFKYDDGSGNSTNFLRRGVNLIFEQCSISSKQCPEDLKQDNVTCFCSVASAKYQLCHGTIGWPVVSTADSSIVGLTASNRDCHGPQGSILVAVFDSTTANEVAAMAGGWDKLVGQNSLRPPLYRADPLISKVPFYDYGEDTGQGHAVAIARFSPFDICSILYILHKMNYD